MSDYDPSELLLLCESIIEDGELTYDELYQLAEWLNNHQEACSNWPGSLLVASLQKAWADGKITKTEARQVARIIIEVRKEAAKRDAEKASERTMEIASEAARTFDLTRPHLPAIPFSTRIRSQTKRSAWYEVDLRGPTCTCPDFRSFRHRLTAGHLTRCCKHIFDAYAQLKLSGGCLVGLPRSWPCLGHPSSAGVASSVDSSRMAHFSAARTSADIIRTKSLGERLRSRQLSV
jgi:hypothetical protein